MKSKGMKKQFPSISQYQSVMRASFKYLIAVVILPVLASFLGSCADDPPDENTVPEIRRVTVKELAEQGIAITDGDIVCISGFLMTFSKISISIYDSPETLHPAISNSWGVSILDGEFIGWHFETPIQVEVTGKYYSPAGLSSLGALKDVETIKIIRQSNRRIYKPEDVPLIIE